MGVLAGPSYWSMIDTAVHLLKDLSAISAENFRIVRLPSKSFLCSAVAGAVGLTNNSPEGPPHSGQFAQRVDQRAALLCYSAINAGNSGSTATATVRNGRLSPIVSPGCQFRNIEMYEPRVAQVDQ